MTKRAEEGGKQCLQAHRLSEDVIQCFEKCEHSFQDLLSGSAFEKDALHLKR